MATSLTNATSDNLMKTCFKTDDFINAYVDNKFDALMKIDIEKNPAFETIANLAPSCVSNWTDEEEEKEHKTFRLKFSKFLKVYDEKNKEINKFDPKTDCKGKIYKIIFEIAKTTYKGHKYINARIIQMQVKDKPIDKKYIECFF